MSGEFLTPEQAQQRYAEIIPIFIAAFADEPWFEVSKCVDANQPKFCPNGFSPTAVGDMCSKCNLAPTEAAYTYAELTEEFDKHANSYPMRWYVEYVDKGMALASYANLHSTDTLLETSYRRHADDMRGPLDEIMREESVAWIHEVFANRSIRPSGNLRNFGAMCISYASYFEVERIMFCTLNARMISAAQREFENKVKVYKPNEDIPDHRALVVINL